MALTYNQVKAELAAASALTGGKFVAFDAKWYVRQYQNVVIVREIGNPPVDTDVGLAHFSGDPLEHYVLWGHTAALRPSQWFNPAFYRSEYADVRNMSDADVLVHYAKFGVNEGRAPNLATKYFDGARYLAENPDVVPYITANLSQFGGSVTNGAIAHFVKFGGAEQRLGFDTTGARLQFAELPESAALAPTDVGNGVIQISVNTNAGNTILTGNKALADGSAAPTVRFVGDAAVRWDATNKADQFEGLDLNGNGVIAANGVENNLRGANIITAKNFTSFDAYPRNAINEGDRTNNMLGNIAYDGTGYAGDGVNTNGNIFLGGLGIDTAQGGIGNDFLAGGGVAGAAVNAARAAAAALPVFVAPVVTDRLYGGRNADFFFAELSLLDNTDGNTTTFDGGATADDSAAGGIAFGSLTDQSTQDTDWILVEASDDDEVTTVNLFTDTLQTRSTARTAGTLTDIENVDASGDLYGFLNKTGATVGARNDEVRDGRLPAHTFGAENYGVGSTAQLSVTGSSEANKLIGGYDNDKISGNAGSDVIMGGKLSYLLNYRNNPNLLTADGKGLDLNVNSVGVVSDGRDILEGGADNDGLLFAMDGGSVEGGTTFGTTGALAQSGDESDTLYMTNFTMGRTKGWTNESEVTSSSKGESDALAALTKDSAIRLDLGVGAGEARRGYGGADVDNNFVSGGVFTADQTQYKDGVPRSTVQDIENVIATGLGWAGSAGSAMDFLAAGGNGADDQVKNNAFRNQQNFFGTTTATYDLRGVSGVDGQDARTYNNLFTDTQFGYNTSGVALTTQFDPGDNTLYAGNKNDILEGRIGDDRLMGGFGDDTFYVSLTRGDDFDVIHRQVDGNNDNIWDGTFAQDFRVKGQVVAGTPTKITFNIENPDAVQGVSVTYAGTVINASGQAVIDATNLAGLATAINTAFQAIDKNVTAAVEGTKLVVIDATGRTASSASLAGDPAFKNGLETVVQGTGTSTSDEFDRLVFKSYQDDKANLGVDDTKNGLGNNAYAKDLVVDFTGKTTTLAERQEWRIQFQNLNQGDVVTVNINGKTFSAIVGTNYDGTQIPLGETTDAFVTRFTDQFKARQLDISSRSGDVDAAKVDAFTNILLPAAVTEAEAVLVLQELEATSPDNREHVFMQTPVVTIVNAGGAASGTYRIANTSDSSVELFQFDGQNGQLNANDVLFVGQTGYVDKAGAIQNYDVDKNLRTEDGSIYSYAVLQTALTAGGTLNGKEATVVTVNTLETAMHGHDLLIGGDGPDVIKGLGGDDTILGSKGNDSVDGGQDAAATTKQRFVDKQTAIDFTTGGDGNANQRLDYSDTLLYREADFGDGTSFRNTVDGNLASRGKGSVSAVDAKGAALGKTDYEEIELVRTLNNTREDTLDFSLLSNSVATATGVSALSTEGVFVNFKAGDSDIKYNVDLDASNTLAGAAEVAVLVGRAMGFEHVDGGNANDQVTMDETQLDAKNKISLGGQIDQTSPAPLLVEGFDLVKYEYSAGFKLLAANIPVVTVKVEDGSNFDTVTFSGGALTGAVPGDAAADTLTNVENLDITDVARSVRAADVLNVSGIAGATVNMTTLGQLVAESLGGDIVATTVAQVEGNTFEAGGVSKTGSGLGNELLEITGIQQFEQVIGSTGSDRVLLGETNLLAGANVRASTNNVPTPNFFDQGLGFNFHGRYTTATRTFDTNTVKNVDNKGLYTFNLGDGDDALDYRLTGGTDDVAVVVDFTATATDWVVVDNNVTAGTGFTNAFTINDGLPVPIVDGKDNSRVDQSINVERYFGSVNALNQRNAIDLTRATEATTVVFGAEQSLSSNEYLDPNGRNLTVVGNAPLGTAVATAADQVTGISVATTAATGTVVARFMNASASAGGNGEALWNFVEGSNFAETVVMSGTQDLTKNETLNLRGGANIVDYSNAVLAKISNADAYSAAIGDATVTASTTVTHVNATVTHTGTKQTGGIDTITVDRQYDATKANIDGGLTLIGSVNGSDMIDIALLAAPQGVGTLSGVKSNITGLQLTGVTSNLVDITGTKSDTLTGGYNLVDLGSGGGVTSGTVVQDVKLGIKGQSLVNDGVVTNIRGWENITGGVFNDRLFGNDNTNIIVGGGGSDIMQGRGAGDTLTAGAGSDRLVYAGASETGHILGTVLTSAAQVDQINQFDDAFGGLPAPATDYLVLDGIGSVNFPLVNTVVQSSANYGATVDIAAGAVVLAGDPDAIAPASMYDMNLVVTNMKAALILGPALPVGANQAGAILNTGAAVKVGDQVAFFLDATNNVGLYLWTAGVAGDLTIDSTELQLLAVLDDTTVATGIAPDVSDFRLTDLALRYSATLGKQTVLLNPGVRDELVYTAQNQSTFGQLDIIGRFNSTIVGPPVGTGAIEASFVSGEDKIDLSALNLGATNGLLINSIVTRDMSGAPAITETAAARFFYTVGGDTSSQQVAVVVEFDRDDGDNGTLLNQGRARVFVDLDGNGNLDTSVDMAIDISIDGALPVAGHPQIPVYTDFIFVI